MLKNANSLNNFMVKFYECQLYYVTELLVCKHYVIGLLQSQWIKNKHIQEQREQIIYRIIIDLFAFKITIEQCLDPCDQAALWNLISDRYALL